VLLYRFIQKRYLSVGENRFKKIFFINRGLKKKIFYGYLLRNDNTDHFWDYFTMENLKIATCQFEVSSNINSNYQNIKKYIVEAGNAQADVIHFSECALSGYLGHHNPKLTIEKLDSKHLESIIEEICHLAKKYSIWIILGVSHVTAKDTKNSLYIINDQGNIKGRYDKINLYDKETTHFSKGNDLVTVDIKNIKCGFMICYDSCFPKLYEEYSNLGVKIIFHSFYNADNAGGETELDRLIISQQITRAADNRFWIVASNSSKYHSRLASGFIYPDGKIKLLQKNEEGIIYDNIPSKNLGWTY